MDIRIQNQWENFFNPAVVRHYSPLLWAGPVAEKAHTLRTGRGAFSVTLHGIPQYSHRVQADRFRICDAIAD